MERSDWMMLFFAARDAATPDPAQETADAPSGWAATFRAAARQRTRASSTWAFEHEPEQTLANDKRMAEAGREAPAPPGRGTLVGHAGESATYEDAAAEAATYEDAAGEAATYEDAAWETAAGEDAAAEAVADEEREQEFRSRDSGAEPEGE